MEGRFPRSEGIVQGSVSFDGTEIRAAGGISQPGAGSRRESAVPESGRSRDFFQAAGTQEKGGRPGGHGAPGRPPSARPLRQAVICAAGIRAKTQFFAQASFPRGIARKPNFL